ncbi:hypothetical protein MLD38_021003 [Melastoma candidum]|uniref:Uncharacterized protein n=1 Tax=Melastoma candidum TaxID=119954 RepID=A0ACB9QG01_9MYRT|nr:hypothetical protein MLD38_021003 [Melastoma candidum]
MQLVEHIRVSYCPVGKPVDIGGSTCRASRDTSGLLDEANEIFEDVIEKHLQERVSASGRRDDFLDVLLDQCQDVNYYLDRGNIKPLILELFIAGTDTSSITTEWAMAVLIRSPATLRKVKEEITRVIGTENRSKNLTSADSRTFKLSSRRRCGFTPLPLSSSRTSPKRTWRFKEGISFPRAPRISSTLYSGRAGGSAPGLPLASRMVHLMVASLIQSFEWKLLNGMLPDDLDMREQFGATLPVDYRVFGWSNY